jgi:hypothetical protein
MRGGTIQAKSSRPFFNTRVPLQIADVRPQESSKRSTQRAGFQRDSLELSILGSVAAKQNWLSDLRFTMQSCVDSILYHIEFCYEVEEQSH